MNSFRFLLRAAKNHNINLKRNLYTTPCRLSSTYVDGELDKNVSDRFLCLPIPEPKTIVSYVWIDGTGLDLRYLTKTLNNVPGTYKDCRNCSFDGSSSFMGTPEKSDNYLVPIAMYADPFRRGNNRIVLCETFTHDKKPTKTNRRQSCIEVLNKVCDQEVMFGFEQEFYFMAKGGQPLGWPAPLAIGKNYAGIGGENTAGREIVECIYRCGLYAGIDVCASIAERAYSQWEICIGPTASIKAADDLWMLRYIILAVAEAFGVTASFHPNIVEGGIPSGLHTAMSTKKTREEGGYKTIQDYMVKMEKRHQNDLKYFDCRGGDHLKKRLTGKPGTSTTDKFTYGVGDRTASVKINPMVADKKKGYFEDRRPSSCADPYNIITALVSTCLL